MKDLSGIVIADEHFGAIDSNQLYEEHKRIVIDFLETLDSLDVIFIAGDFFDHILYLNEDDAKIAYMVMEELFHEAKRLGSKIRIIYGTESHECNQYKIFTNYILSSFVDVRVIRHVEEEELFDGIYVLYLPEEFIYNKGEYYKEYFSQEKKYDYIIGHGVIHELMETAAVHTERTTKDSKHAKVPIFTSSELSKCCKGTVYFGHYHENSSIQNKIFYVGSFSRWKFGEEKPKGFYYFKKHKNSYSHEFIENTLCDKYTTFHYGYESKIFKSEEIMEQEWSKIERLYSDDNNHIRLMINVPDDYPNAEGLLTFLSERFKNQKNIKINVVNGYVNKKQKINREYLDNTIKKFSFIFDKSMPISEQVKSFIETKWNEELSADRIDLHLKTKNILEIPVEESDE